MSATLTRLDQWLNDRFAFIDRMPALPIILWWALVIVAAIAANSYMSRLIEPTQFQVIWLNDLVFNLVAVYQFRRPILRWWNGRTIVERMLGGGSIETFSIIGTIVITAYLLNAVPK